MSGAPPLSKRPAPGPAISIRPTVTAAAGMGPPATRPAAGAETAQPVQVVGRLDGPDQGRVIEAAPAVVNPDVRRRVLRPEVEVTGPLDDPVNEIAGNKEAKLEHRDRGHDSKHLRPLDAKQPRLHARRVAEGAAGRPPPVVL